MVKKFLLYTLIFLNISGFAQNISEKGIPYIKNYLPQDYGNHGKIWEIVSAGNGLVYMASDNGLLEFDGNDWKRFRAYRGHSRSLFLENDSTISIGADMDFGFWKKNKIRSFEFSSLYPFKKNGASENEEFWGTHQLPNVRIYVSHHHIYHIFNKKITRIPAPSKFSKSFQIGNEIFLVDEVQGLFQLKNKSLFSLAKFPDQSMLKIAGIYKNQEKLFLVSEKNGIYRLDQGKFVPMPFSTAPEIFKNKVFSFETLNDKYLAFGTILNGLYITDLAGNIIQHINKDKGLPNNTVLSLHYQKNGKLWLGLDYGISVINIADEVTYIYDNQNNFGTAYTALLNNNTLLLGTNQGLYWADWATLGKRGTTANAFNLIPGSEGQVWVLKKIGGKILCGHDNGLFEVKDNNLVKISGQQGVLSILQTNGYLFTGNYNGISVYDQKDDSWVFRKKLKSIFGAVNQLVSEDHRTFWANIPNYGILSFTLDSLLEPRNRIIYSSKNFKGYFPDLFIENNRIQVQTGIAHYIYNRENREFEQKSASLQGKNVHDVISGFYRPLRLNSEFGFYGVNNGFAIERKLKNANKTEVFAKLQIREAISFNNDEQRPFSGVQKLPYQFNNVRFTFLMPNEDGVQYQYFLENYSESWSSWSDNPTAYFLGLREGKYLLKIRAKKGLLISDEADFQFSVQSPWYRSIVSYLVYFMIAVGLVFLVRESQKRKLRKQKKHLLEREKQSLQDLAEKHRQEMLIQKQRRLEEEKESLKLQVKNKTIELAKKAKEDDDK
ncbi:MAG: hypothetical protein ACXWCA_04670, partial [Kaistella sp.]